MPITDTTFYRTRDEILSEMLAALVAAIPDAYIGEDGVARIILEINAGQLENAFLANQLNLEDMFITTASHAALQRYGEEQGVPMKAGTQAVGEVTFDGEGGTFVPIGTEVAYDPGGGLDPIFFTTLQEITLPNPGDPDAPSVAIDATAGNLNGIYEYKVAFVTASGETLASPESDTVSPVNQQVDVTNIPVGGAGTTARRIYRAKDGSGIFRRVHEIANNVDTSWQDNVTDATMNGGALEPSVNTANRGTSDAEAQQPGIESNVAIGAITELTDAPATLVSVTNGVAFTGGTEPEDTEEYRQRLLQHLRAPGSGSPLDLKSWAEAVAGVETATVFPNDPVDGTTTVRISGPGGTVPSSEVVDAVQAELESKDLAIITIVVATFTPVSTNVTVDVTVETGFTLAEVDDSVIAAIQAYINGLSVGETLRISGVVDAVFGLAGVLDVTVTSPGANVTVAATEKHVPGTITVT